MIGRDPELKAEGKDKKIGTLFSALKAVWLGFNPFIAGSSPQVLMTHSNEGNQVAFCPQIIQCPLSLLKSLIVVGGRT